MRSIIRQSKCLACHTHIRQSEGRRTFQTSLPRASDSRPSNHPSEEPSSLDREREDKENDEPHEESSTVDTEHGEAKTANEARRSSFRRTLRQKRVASQTFDPPPPLPEWFLKSNILLARQALRDTDLVRVKLLQRKQTRPCEKNSVLSTRVSCIDTDRNTTLFDIPHYRSIAPKALDRPSKPEIAESSGGSANIAEGRTSVQASGAEREPTEPQSPSTSEAADVRNAQSQESVKESSEGAKNEEVTCSHDTKGSESQEKCEGVKKECGGTGDLDIGIAAKLQELSKSVAKRFYNATQGTAAIEATEVRETQERERSQDRPTSLETYRSSPHKQAMRPTRWTTEHLSAKTKPIPDSRRIIREPSEEQMSSWRSLAANRTLWHCDWFDDISAWAFLEAEAGILAAFALAQPRAGKPSFAASRVDLSLLCADPNSHEGLDVFVASLARNMGADLIRVDAGDLGELAADSVETGRDEPGSYANLGYDVYDGYEAADSRSQRSSRQAFEEQQDDEAEEDDEDVDDARYGGPEVGGHRKITTAFIGGNFGDLKRALESSGVFANRGGGRGSSGGIVPPQRAATAPSGSRSTDPVFSHETSKDTKIANLLDQLLDGPRHKSQNLEEKGEHPGALLLARERLTSLRLTEECREWSDIAYTDTWKWFTDVANILVAYCRQAILKRTDGVPKVCLDATATTTPFPSLPSVASSGSTIVHVRDLRDLGSMRKGDEIIGHLLKSVKSRRARGEKIILVGTSAQDVADFQMVNDAAEDHPFRTISVPPFFKLKDKETHEFSGKYGRSKFGALLDAPEQRILEINLRHLQRMFRSLQVDIDLLSEEAYWLLDHIGMSNLAEKTLSFDDVQRLALTAIGLQQQHAKSDKLSPMHICLANHVLTNSDHLSEAWPKHKAVQEKRSRAQKAGTPAAASAGTSFGSNEDVSLEKVKKSCNQHESRLLSGVVNPQNIKVGFGDVHVSPDTIDALKTLTSLSLLRPDAFQYGVLAKDRLSGLLLYGPPGTGKTLLAKAVAKESKAAVMEVSGAQIYEKYVGEGEKMVRAVFSLAKKLSPCIVFLDEADAIFGSRSNAGNRTTHREIINQFLREWDGMEDHGVFIMVASNRPFDLDDAVLRRLPRRLLVDLPSVKDREAILGIHLRDEGLEGSVSLSQLAEQTPLYSGSDLKNLAVAAALAAVRDENSQKQADPDFKLPEKRTLTSDHFEKALTEISASMSEDMATLTAIRKFDEQYGDRKGRKKKSGMGFGASEAPIDENAARVRHGTPPGSTPGGPSPSPPQ